jgi:hypothetical protein
MSTLRIPVGSALVLGSHNPKTGELALEVIGRDGETLAGVAGSKAQGRLVSHNLHRAVTSALIARGASLALRLAAHMIRPQ